MGTDNERACDRDPCCGEPDACDPDRHLRGARVVEAMAAIQTPVPVDPPVGTLMEHRDGLKRVYAGRGEWVQCDGRALNQDDYARLFAVIGHNYGGVVEDERLFRLPDMRQFPGADPILYYDVSIDERRPITQAEFDQMEATLHRFRSERDEAREDAISTATDRNAWSAQCAALVTDADKLKAHIETQAALFGSACDMIAAREATIADLTAKLAAFTAANVIPDPPSPIGNAIKHREREPWRMGPEGV